MSQRDSQSTGNKHDPHVFHTNSAAGLASQIAHRCRDWPSAQMPRRRRGTGLTAATSMPGLCFEWPSSHISARLAFTGVSHLSTSRYPSVAIIKTSTEKSGPVVHTVVDEYRCHYRPPCRPRRASDGTYRAVRPSGPSASSSCRRMLKFAANERSALGRIHKKTGRQRRTSRILLSTSLVQRTQLSTKTNKDAMSCRVRPSAVGNQSTPLAAPAGCVMKKPKKRPMGQPHWMWFQTPPVLTWRRGGRERRDSRVLT